MLIVGRALQFLLRRALPEAGPHSAGGSVILALVSAAALGARVHAALRAAGRLSSVAETADHDAETSDHDGRNPHPRVSAHPNIGQFTESSSETIRPPAQNLVLNTR
jgi:hypothetical protein